MARLVSLIRKATGLIIPPTITLLERDAAWLETALGQLPGYGTAIKRFPLDAKYWTCSGADFAKAIIWDWTNQKPWVKDERDCDDFAFQFKADLSWFFGITTVAWVDDFSSAHAYNIVVLDDGKPRVFEPQTDRWGLQGKPEYKLTDAIIII